MIGDKWYILDSEGNPVGVSMEDYLNWSENCRKMGIDSRRVAKDVIGNVLVSTVLLPLDHRWEPIDGSGDPIVFETMIFGGEHDSYQERYTSKEEALKGHQRAVQMVNDELSNKQLVV